MQTSNLAGMIEGHDPDSIALISRGRSTSYGQLRDQVAGLRGGLRGLGVEPGDRVAVLCGNNRYFVVSYLAIVGLGAVVVPLNPSSPGPEIEKELAAVEPVVAIVGPHALAAWDDVDPSTLPSLRSVVLAEGDPTDGQVALADLIATDPVELVDVAPDALAALMFTSGTAGEPRAAMLTHGNLQANIDQGASIPDRTRAGDVVYGVLPLFHIFGLNVLLGVSLSVGATVVLVQRFDPATAAESIVERSITVVPGAPPLWVAFSHFDELPADTFASVRVALSGASRLPPAVSERIADRFGVHIAEGYGLTEASPVVSTSSGIPIRVGSVGKVLAGQEVRIVGSDGEPVPVGDAGEIWVRGPNVFVGYWNDQEATDRVLVDGWLRTGDIGLADEDGYLYLVDRAKDLIIVSGFNVYPAEVEDVLRSHPSVAEAAVVGVPHPHQGEAVRAFVVLGDGAEADEDGLIDFAAASLARYKCPSKVLFVDALPRNASGKLVRRELQGTVLSEPRL